MVVCVTVVGLVWRSFLCPQFCGLLLQFMCVPKHVVIVVLCIEFGAS